MAVNKIQYNNSTLIDVSSDTISADRVTKNYKFMKKDGTYDYGTFVASGLPDQFTAGDFPILANMTQIDIPASSTTLKSYGLSLVVPKTGQYRVRWGASGGDDGYGDYTVKSRVYVNGTAKGTQKSTDWHALFTEDLQLNQNDVVDIYGASYRGYPGEIFNLMLCINFDPLG